MTDEEMEKHGISACEYRFEGNRDIRVSWRGTGLWAVTSIGFCLNKNKEWESEPQPSSRDDAFFDRCRFSLHEALQLALECIETGNV